MATRSAHNRKIQVQLLNPQQSHWAVINMNLPELPIGKNRKEAKVDGKVAEWFLNNYHRPIILEVKIKGGTVKEHQDRLLKKIANKLGFKYKFRDGATRTPCDYVIFPKGSDADGVLATCDGNECECVINGKEILNIKV